MTHSSRFFILSALLMAFLVLVPVHACMTFVVTPGASADGSMYVGHIEDGYGESLVGANISKSNIHLLSIPPADHSPGSKRTIHYDPYAVWTAPLNPPVNITASIEQVNHTYGYLTTNYGAINEYQLMSGEAGRASKVMPEWDPEKRIMYTSELTNIAMERCKTAREAVVLVGDLVERYGFYSSGEIITFADPKEAWVMEFAGGTPNGTGGLWVAQKIRNGDVFSSANAYRIREVKQNNPDMLYSPRLFNSAEKNGWWNEKDGPLDWAATVGTGEYSHPYYSFARVWSMYNRVAPSLNLSPYAPAGPTDPYPFSVKPDKPLETTDVFNLVRDHYEGTPFDLTKGIAAGPFGNPYRITGPYEYGDIVIPGVIAGGAWHRPVSTLYSPYTYIAQGKSGLPYPVGGVCWFGFGPAYETVFMPIYAGVTGVPRSFTVGERTLYSPDSAWWPFNLVANIETLRYDRISQDIRAEQDLIEGAELGRQSGIETNAVRILKTYGEAAVKEYLTNYTKTNAESVITSRWDLLTRLNVQYLNGDMYEDGLPDETGYPAWWLDAAGYQYGPRIYQLEELQQIQNLRYENHILTAKSGDEITVISAMVSGADEPVSVPPPNLLTGVPDVRQSQSYSCGAASLQAVLNYWGTDVREEVLMEQLNTSLDVGTSPDAIVKLARGYGLWADMRTNVTLSDLEQSIARKIPVIIDCQSWKDESTTNRSWENDWEDGHYMVVIGLDRDNVYLEDPAMLGTRGVIPRQEFLSRWHDYLGVAPFNANSTVVSHVGIFIHGKVPTVYPEFTHVD